MDAYNDPLERLRDTATITQSLASPLPTSDQLLRFTPTQLQWREIKGRERAKARGNITTGIICAILAIATFEPSVNQWIKASALGQFISGNSSEIQSGSQFSDVVSVDGAKIVAIAQSWIGKEFNPGATAQCAYFIRAVLEEAGVSVGVTSSPHDGYTTSEGYANSFFGDDIGTLIMDESQLKPGDLVAFSNTYGDWPSGTITHVGVYVGDGTMIDRPTASQPVQQRSISQFDFAVGVRLNQVSERAIATTDNDLGAIAQRLESEYGIPAAFTEAVGLHETGNGSAIIGEDNWFGVKGSGETVTTMEVYDGSEVMINDSFCSSGCPDSFARTVTNILSEQGLEAKGMSPEAIADAVGGIYATDPRWSEKVKEHLQ